MAERSRPSRPSPVGAGTDLTPIEVELKFMASGPAPLRALARRQRLGPAHLGPAEVIDEVDRYLDTADGRLAAARWACRLRARGERVIVSLKGPPRSGAGGPGLHRRPEVEGPATDSLDPATWPASAARDRLLEMSAGRPLSERLALHQRRTQRDVLVGGRVVGALSLDRVRVARGPERSGRLWSVELELSPASAGDDALIAALRAALERLSGLAPDAQTKLEHAETMLADAGA
jgi:inorganic triphosphatase YgiF